MNDKGGMNANHEGSIKIEADATPPVPGDGAARRAGAMPHDPSNLCDGQLTEAELRELLGRAEQGDRTMLTALRRLLDSRPALWRLCGDVANTAQADWIDLIAGRNLVVRESLVRKITELKGEIAAPDASPLERLLAERVTACWLQANHADSVAAQLKGQERTIAQLDLIQKRQERTQRSFVAAIKSLAVVRKLAVVVVPAAPAEVAVSETPSPSRAAKGRTRSEGDAIPASHPATNDRPARSDRQWASKPRSPRCEEVVPRVIRDRMIGFVGSDD